MSLNLVSFQQHTHGIFCSIVKLLTSQKQPFIQEDLCYTVLTIIIETTVIYLLFHLHVYVDLTSSNWFQCPVLYPKMFIDDLFQTTGKKNHLILHLPPVTLNCKKNSLKIKSVLSVLLCAYSLIRQLNFIQKVCLKHNKKIIIWEILML